MRLKILISLVLIGLFGIKQLWFFGDYCVGMENVLAFWGLLILYVILFLIETGLNLNEKKSFDKSSIYITIGLGIILAVTQNIKNFKPEIELTARTEKGFGHKLELRKNGKFDLTRHYVKTDCYYYGKYNWDKDTLEIDGKGQIDGKYLWNKKDGKLISISGYFDDFIIYKTSP